MVYFSVHVFIIVEEIHIVEDSKWQRPYNLSREKTVLPPPPAASTVGAVVTNAITAPFFSFRYHKLCRNDLIVTYFSSPPPVYPFTA